MLESLDEDAQDDEQLLQTDVGITRMRRLLSAIAEGQTSASKVA